MSTQIAHAEHYEVKRPAKRARTSATRYHTPRSATTTLKNMPTEREMETAKAPECVVGVAVVWGTPAVEACSNPAELDAAMVHSVQTDNAKFLSHLIRQQGWRPSPASSNYTFGITIDETNDKTRAATSKLAMSSSTSTGQVWCVSSATPLHLALSCGSFKAAAVLLVAFPDFATQTCTVTTPTNQQLSW
eukprot:3038028-Rhodomonas_salina.1